jgi:VanZ family protein
VIKKGLLLVALVYTLALVVVTFIDLNGVPELGSSFDDKIYHTLAYVGLGFLWLTYFKYIKSLKHTLPVFLVVLSFGILMELLQHQINANRTFDLVDLLSNCLGVSVGTIIAHYCNILKLNILKGLFILFIIN